METVLKKIAEKYLQVLLKDYQAKKKELDVAVFKGVIKLPNVELNTDFIQSMVGIRHISFKRVACGSLHLKIPWSKLQEKPVVVTITTLDLDLEEPEELVTIDESYHNIFGGDSKKKKKKDDKKKKKRHWFDAAWENVTIKVDEVRIRFQTQGRPTANTTPPAIALTIKGVNVVSVNANWEEEQLTELLAENKGRSVLMIRKLITLDEMHFRIGASRPNASDSDSMLSPRSPRVDEELDSDALDAEGMAPFFTLGDGEGAQALQVRLAFRRHAQRGTIFEVHTDMTVGDVNVDWVRDVYRNLLESVEGIVWCLKKEQLAAMPAYDEKIQRLRTTMRHSPLLTPRGTDAGLLSPRPHAQTEYINAWDEAAKENTKKLLEEFVKLEEEADQADDEVDITDDVVTLTDQPLASVSLNVDLACVLVKLRELDVEAATYQAGSQKRKKKRYKTTMLTLEEMKVTLTSEKTQSAQAHEEFARFISLEAELRTVLLADMDTALPLIQHDRSQTFVEFKTVVGFNGEASMQAVEKIDFSLTTTAVDLLFERKAFRRFSQFLGSRSVVMPPSAPRVAVHLDMEEPQSLSIRMRFGALSLLVLAPEKHTHTHDIRVVLGPTSLENLPTARSQAQIQDSAKTDEGLRWKASTLLKVVVLPVRFGDESNNNNTHNNGNSDESKEITVLSPMDIQVMIEVKRYIATIRRYFAMDMPKSKIFPTTQRVEVSVIISNFTLFLEEPILASVLQGNLQLIKLLRKPGLEGSMSARHVKTGAKTKKGAISLLQSTQDGSQTGSRRMKKKKKENKESKDSKDNDKEITSPVIANARIPTKDSLTASGIRGSRLRKRNKSNELQQPNATERGSAGGSASTSSSLNKSAQRVRVGEEAPVTHVSVDSSSKGSSGAKAKTTIPRINVLSVPKLDMSGATESVEDGTASQDAEDSISTSVANDAHRINVDLNPRHKPYESSGIVKILATLPVPLYVRVSINPGDKCVQFITRKRVRDKDHATGFSGGFNLYDVVEGISLEQWASMEVEEVGLHTNFQCVDVLIEHRQHRHFKARLHMVHLRCNLNNSLLLMPISIDLSPVEERIGEALVEGTHGLEAGYEFQGTRPRQTLASETTSNWHPHNVSIRLVGTSVTLIEHGQLNGPPMQALNTMITQFVDKAGLNTATPAPPTKKKSGKSTVAPADPTNLASSTTLGMGFVGALNVRCEIGDSQIALQRCQDDDVAEDNPLSKFIGADFFRLHFSRADRRILAEQVRKFERQLQVTDKQKRDLELSLGTKLAQAQEELKDTESQLIMAKINLAEAQEESTKLQKKVRDMDKEKLELDSKVKAVTATYNAVLGLLPKTGGAKFKANRRAAAGGGVGAPTSGAALGIVATMQQHSNQAATLVDEELGLQQLADQKVDAEKRLIEANSKISDLESYIARLQTQLDQSQAKSEVKRLSDDLIRFEKENKFMAQENERLRTQLEDYNQMLNARDDQLEQVQRERQFIEDELEAMKTKGNNKRANRRLQKPAPEPALGMPSEVSSSSRHSPQASIDLTRTLAVDAPSRWRAKSVSREASPMRNSLGSDLGGRTAKARSVMLEGVPLDSSVSKPPALLVTSMTNEREMMQDSGDRSLKQSLRQRLRGDKSPRRSQSMPKGEINRLLREEKEKEKKEKEKNNTPNRKSRLQMAGKKVLMVNRFKNLNKSGKQDKKGNSKDDDRLRPDDTAKIVRGSRLQRMKAKMSRDGNKRVSTMLTPDAYVAPQSLLRTSKRSRSNSLSEDHMGGSSSSTEEEDSDDSSDDDSSSSNPVVTSPRNRPFPLATSSREPQKPMSALEREKAALYGNDVAQPLTTKSSSSRDTRDMSVALDNIIEGRDLRNSDGSSADDMDEIERLRAHAEMMQPAPNSLVPSSFEAEQAETQAPPAQHAPQEQSDEPEDEDTDDTPIDMDQFLASPATVRAGNPVELLYALPSWKHHKYDWVGLFNRLESNAKKYESYSWKKSYAGKLTFKAPQQPGVYEFRVFRGGNRKTYYNCVRTSNPIVVTAKEHK